jgi:hypothetical protein
MSAGFYIAYLRRLAEKREQAGLPPAEEIAPDEYWQKRCENEALKQLPLKKAA